MHRIPLPSALTGALLGSTLLAGCTSVPHLGAPPEPRPAASFAAAQTVAKGMPVSGWPANDWWRAYGDPQLTALIEEGLKGAPSVEIAAARLRAAQGSRQQAGGALLPTIDAKANAAEAKQSYNNGIPSAFVPKGWNDTGGASFSLDFDLDLWGKNRAALRAATSDAVAAELDVQEARLVLSTNIASAYAELAQQYAERDVEELAIQSRIDTQSLVANRFATGLDTKAELKQADAAVPSARADLAATDESIGLTRNSLAALLGAGPDRGLAIARPKTLVQARGIPADVTTNLIGRRPDVAAARARVQSAAERIKVARADFYPAVSISALAGFQSLGLSNLFKSGSTYGNATPAISLPVFHGGAIAGQYRTARATYDEAVATYDSTVADAYHDVADAVTSLAMLTERLKQTQQALADAEEGYAVARLRYEGGLSTYLTVLTAQDTVLQNRRTVSDLQARAFTLDVALVRALGGGLTSDTLPSAVPSAATTEPAEDTHHG
jgi:NodT family efflux transporter outer membrane factor (OMF) lipoprotein